MAGRTGVTSISFGKATYTQGESVTINYSLRSTGPKLRLKDPSGTALLTKTPSAITGSYTYTLSGSAPLGAYRAELFYPSLRPGEADTIVASATMNVVSGVPSAPPDEGETRELDLGDYEVTWSLSGRDTLKAEIRVTDTGVTCLSVTGEGACNSITAPGVLVIAFTVTGYLKSAVAPPTEGYLRVTTSPTGALVMVNGTSCGATPVTKCTLSTGTKTVTFTKSGYDTATRTVTIRAGEIEDIGTITLTPTAAPPTPPDAAKFGLSEIVENHLPEWITGYACAGCGARYPYICPAGYKRTECVEQAAGSHGCCSSCLVVFVKCEREGVAPPVGIGGWIDESGVTNLTKDHAAYVFYVSAGAVSAADGKYEKLSPKPSKLDPSFATKDTAIGIFYYSQGAMAAGNGKTGCNY